MGWAALEMARGPVELFHLDYTKADLKEVPEDKVIFFFMMAQLHNDMNAMLRVAISNYPKTKEGEEEGAEEINQAITCFMAIRVLAGRLEEGWKVIKERFGRYFTEYETRIHPQESYKTLRIYFSSPNVIRSIRDKAGYHFNIESMRRSYRDLPDEIDFRDYNAKILGNTLYWGAERVLTHSATLLVKEIKPELENDQCLSFLVAEVIRISELFLDVTSAYCLAFLEENLDDLHSRAMQNVEIVYNQPEHQELQGAEFIYAEQSA